MTSTVGIDSKLDKILIRARINNNTPRQVYIDDVKSFIREVAKEVIGQNEPRIPSETNNLQSKKRRIRNAIKDEQRAKLNKILGKEK